MVDPPWVTGNCRPDQSRQEAAVMGVGKILRAWSIQLRRPVVFRRSWCGPC